ncbi:hypothetical protein M0R72_13010 [Candidatus Pacearchaeota archaeon]|jgi:hypothetical protein|nr:hypothetical protein [Candidatus Pacearchaeota archaeon]
MGVEIKIEGIEKAEKRIDGLIIHIESGVEKINMQEAQFLRGKVRKEAPQGPTGKLKRNVKAFYLAQRGSNPRTAIVKVGQAKYEAPHAHLVESGTAERFQKSGKSVGAMPGEPFFEPTVKEYYSEMQDRRLKKMKKLVDEF